MVNIVVWRLHLGLNYPCSNSVCKIHFKYIHSEKNAACHQYFMITRFSTLHLINCILMFFTTTPNTYTSFPFKHMKLDALLQFENALLHILKWGSVFMIASLQHVSHVFDPSSLRQPQMLDIQIYLHLFLFPFKQMGTSDRMTIRCYYFLFFPPQ